MVDFPLEKETPKVNSIPFILGPVDSPANIPLKNLPGQHGLRSPIIRKFMEADRTYSDGFIGASSNEKKMDDFFGKHSGVTHQKNGSSNRLPSLKRLWTGHEFLLAIVV